MGICISSSASHQRQRPWTRSSRQTLTTRQFHLLFYKKKTSKWEKQLNLTAVGECGVKLVKQLLALRQSQMENLVRNRPGQPWVHFNYTFFFPGIAICGHLTSDRFLRQVNISKSYDQSISYASLLIFMCTAWKFRALYKIETKIAWLTNM